MSRGGLLTTACALVLLAAPSAAGAHAWLETATPSPGATVQTGPGELRLTFDETVVAQYARVAVVGPGGEDLAGAAHVAGDIVTVGLRRTPTGSYTVRWRMVASDDGHASEGVYGFGVRAAALAPAPAHGVGVPVAPEVLAWLQFAGVVLAGGMLAFRALVTRHGEGQDARVAMWVAVAGAVIGLHAGLLAFLVGAYPIVGGGGLSGFLHTAIEPIRVDTHLGQAWTLMTFAWLGVLALIVAAWTTPRRREPLLAGAGVLALAIAFGLSWASHPAARGTLALLADYAHLVAAALWVGGLVALVILAGSARGLRSSAREELARTSILRFSRLALPTVAVVAVAGVVLMVRDLRVPSELLSSGYGVTLAVKSAVVLAALALGAYHRRVVVPRLMAGAPVAGMRRTLALELGLLAAVLGLAAILSQTAPPG